jgi:O-antigen/teichoic acid export membrane protein
LSSITKFLKGSILLSIASVVVRLSGILVLIPLARLLGSNQLGIYSLVFWLVQSGTMVGRLGIDAAMHRNGSQLYHTNPSATGRLLGVGSTLMTLSFITLSLTIWIWRSPLAEHWLGNKEAEQWLGFAAVDLFLEGMGLVFTVGLLSLHNFNANSLTTSVGAIGRLLLSPLLTLNYGLFGAFLGLVLASFLQLGVAGVNFYHSLKKAQIKMSLQGFRQESKQIFHFGLPFYAGNALIGLVSLPMMGELGRVAGLEALGQLRIGQSMSQIVGFLPGAISPVAISVLSEAHAEDGKDFQRLRSLHLRGNWLLALTIVLLMNLSSPFLIDVLFGNEYKAALPLVMGMNWVALLTVVVENLNLYSLSSGNTKAIGIGSIMQKVAFISIALFLIPPWKSMGFVLGLLIGGGLQFAIMLNYLLPDLETSLKKQIGILCLWSGLCLIISYSVNSLNLPNELVAIFAIVVQSIISFLLIRSVTKTEERQKIKSYCFSKFKLYNT